MSTKKVSLFFLLSFFSILNGGFLAYLDFFGFFNGQHAINLIILIGLLISIYLSTITIFILDFSDKHDLAKIFTTVSLFFGLTFFVINKDSFMAISTVLIYFVFLYYIYITSARRENLFIKFSPRELFSPVIRKSFFYIVLLLVLVSFFQTRLKLEHNNLVSPQLVVLFTKPSVAILNRQVGGKLNQEITAQLGANLDAQKKEAVIREVLKQSALAMPKDQSQMYFGLEPNQIPVERTVVYENGNIDFAPVVVAMSPAIANNINSRLASYSFILPFVVPLILFLFLQPFMWPLQFIEMLLTSIIFKLLLATGFITIKKEMKEVEKVRI